MNDLAARLRSQAEAEHPDLVGQWDDLDLCWNVGRAPDGRRIAIIPLMYTSAVIIGAPEVGWYDDRWCYLTVGAALAAARAWDGVGEPEGWHRHPGSGRRREGGDPARETVEP